jgi:hypothetical protein
MTEYTYGTDNDDWDEDDFRAMGGDKQTLRHQLVACIMQMPTQKAWEYITYLDSQDGCMSHEEIIAWNQAVANNDLKAAVKSLVIHRDYITAQWAEGMIDELKTNDYYKEATKNEE